MSTFIPALLDEKKAAKLLKVPVMFLRKSRCLTIANNLKVPAPPWVHVDSRVYYRHTDLIVWKVKYGEKWKNSRNTVHKVGDKKEKEGFK